MRSMTYSLKDHFSIFKSFFLIYLQVLQMVTAAYGDFSAKLQKKANSFFADSNGHFADSKVHLKFLLAHLWV